MGQKGSMFDKRIIAHKQNFDDQGRDLGEEDKIFVLSKELIELDVKTLHTKFSHMFNIEKMTIFRADENVDKSVIGRAVVGGVLTGGIGALVGGMSGLSKNKIWMCEIIEKNGAQHLYRLKNETDAKALKKWQTKHINN